MKSRSGWVGSLTLRTLPLVVGLVLLVNAAWAQTARVWDGGAAGGADSSGDWSAAANWVADDIPDTTGESADLPDVSTGTRTVTMDAGYAIGRVKMTQSTVGAVNKLTLGDTLQLTDKTPLHLTPSAGTSSLVLDISGQTLVTSNSSYYATLNGTINAGTGSLLDFALNNNQNGLCISNLGVTVQNNSTSRFHFAVSSANNDASGIGRKFSNAGTWILTNNAAFLFKGPGGPGGHGLLAGCLNAGTLHVVDGSICTFGGLDSSGTLALGENSVLGNANSTLGILTGGVFNVTGTNAVVGIAPSAAIGSGSVTFRNSGTTTIGLVETPVDFSLRNGTIVLTNQVNGVTALGPRARLFVKYTGLFTFANAGTFMQDDSTMLFDWCATASGTGSPRDFYNSGIWVLENGSQAISYSSEGRPLTWCLNASRNSGVLRLLSGSQLHFRNLSNSGTFELGTNSVAGALTGANPVLNNQGGTVIVSGDAVFGLASNETDTVVFNNGSASFSNSVLTVGDGTNTSTFSILGGGAATLTNFASNSVTIAAGATLAVCVFDDGLPHAFTTRNATINNAGTFTLAGILQQRGNHAGNQPIANSGTFCVSGPNARFELLAGASSNYQTPTLNNSAGSFLTGSGILTYTNRTGNSSNKLAVKIAGTLAPGDPVGTLELGNAAVTFSDATLAIELEDATTFDKLKVSGTGAALSLTGTANVLDVSVVGVNLAVTHRIFEGGPLTGTFDTLLWNGVPVENEYTVTYGADYIDIKCLGPRGTAIFVQ